MRVGSNKGLTVSHIILCIHEKLTKSYIQYVGYYTQHLITLFETFIKIMIFLDVKLGISIACFPGSLTSYTPSWHV